MTTQTVQLQTFDYGASLSSATLRNVATDTLVATADSIDEVTADSGLYAAVFGEASVIAAGTYRFRAVVGGQPINRYVTLAGTDNEVVQARSDRAVELDSSALRAALGMSAADLDDQLDAILAAATAGAGTGARTVTITVDDGETELQNAVVRLTEGANTYRVLTDVDGVAVFNVDDASYSVAITKSGYTYAGTALVVDGDETVAYSMTAVTVTPPTNPDLSAVVVLCLGTDFEPESGVTIDLRIKTLPTGSTNTAYPGMKQTATSNGSGVATLEAPKGSVCEWKRGKEDAWTEITIGISDQTNVTSIIGSRY